MIWVIVHTRCGPFGNFILMVRIKVKLKVKIKVKIRVKIRGRVKIHARSLGAGTTPSTQITVE